MAAGLVSQSRSCCEISRRQSNLALPCSAYRWRLGLIGVDGSGFQFVPAPPAVTQDLFSPAWADDNSIFGQDLTNIYQVDLSGTARAQWKISDALPNADMNSNDRIVRSDDGKSFLVDADLNEEGQIKSWEGPPPAVKDDCLLFIHPNGTASERISGPFHLSLFTFHLRVTAPC